MGSPLLTNITRDWNELQFSLKTNEYDHDFAISLADKNKKKIFDMYFQKDFVQFDYGIEKPFLCDQHNFIVSLRKTGLKERPLIIVVHCHKKIMTWYWENNLSDVPYLHIVNEEFIITDFEFIHTF